MKQYIRTFSNIFETMVNVSNNDWIQLQSTGIIELEKVTIEAYGLTLDEMYEKSGLGTLTPRLAEYGIVLIHKNINRYSTGDTTETSQYVGPTITLDWFMKKLTLLDKFLIKKYGGKHRVMIEFKQQKLAMHPDFYRTNIDKWEEVLGKIKDRKLP